MTNKLTINTKKIDFPDLELRIHNAVVNISNEGFTAFTTPMPSYFDLSLVQLLNLRDQDFIEACFCRILGREADRESIDHYLRKLQKGYDPRSIIAFLRYSEEGEQRFGNADHSLPSLRKYQLFGLPVIGKLVAKLFVFYQKIRHFRLF